MDDSVSSPQAVSHLTPRLISGSVGAIVTALAVTPLEVVKVRQQAGAHVSARTSLEQQLPPNVRPCPRGCGTFVLNNGLMECLLPKSAVPYFDKFGNISEPVVCQATDTMKPKPRTSVNPGVASMLRRIFVKEGFGGIYAGLPATLAMSVPNTVLYFTAYDEIVMRLRRSSVASDAHSSTIFSSLFVPLVGGSSARFLASVATAPLELIRTRQASFVGERGETAPGLWTELRAIVQKEGVQSLYKGLAPTLWRDVPFSAIYWLCLERFREEWKRYDTADETPLRAAGHAFFSGAAAGMIAAAVTTPFDVIKTRRQMVERVSDKIARTESVLCQHQGAIAYKPSPESSFTGTGSRGAPTLMLMKEVAEKEGISSLWRGNQARMLKVAPACAIMISCYELGKRIIEEEVHSTQLR